ncbi:dihydroxyacetone kinase, C-terminal domain [Asanoa hainanensis]|uniref:Dihydroxyacetone kinase, C-terminal domain n=1 Tax=Asanoa hainanensis TaxID=560556 RepID=A0A239GZ64_9ACTN|nr:DAK2 domain-containing protein [Asanoa hainanensis]SNS74506.1 dihydroxyacetone kinase, C-terminal domain [Asanoa hainanensis]
MLMNLYHEAAESAYGELTRLDQAAGDGDYGDNLRAGLRGAVARIPPDADLATEFETAATYFLDEVGGTSGPLIGLLFNDVGGSLDRGGDGDDALVAGLAAGTAAISRVGEASVGDRTMLDCLGPTVDDLRAARPPVDWTMVANQAFDHARATSDLLPRMGRASYVGQRAVGNPDAGAMGMALLFWALAVYRDPAGRAQLPDPARLV